jgi:hypothetical protein
MSTARRKGEVVGYEIGHTPMNKMTVDESCFDTLDDERAWLLGWLFADCHLRMKDGYHALSIETVDELVVKTFVSTLKTEHHIFRRQRSNGKPTMGVHIYGLRTLGPKLEGLGLRIGKTERLPPRIEDIYIRPFIRGYFDGDGSVSSRPLSKGNRLQMNIKGPTAILLWIEENLRQEGICGSHHKELNSFRLSYKIDSSIKFYRWAYHDGCACLPRKRMRFEDFINRGGDVSCPVSTKVGF